MSKITHPELPPYRESIGQVFPLVQRAFQAHWKAHDNAYPKALRLTTQQDRDLYDARRYGQVSLPGATPPARGKFWGVLVEIEDASPGELIAQDGTVMLLADYAPAAPAPK